MMDVLRLGERLPSRPGVFLYAAHNERHWTCLFVGETKDLRSRSGSHECLPEALLLGATHVHYVIMSDKGERLATAERLIFMHGPVLNAIEGPGLNELVQQGVPVMAGQDLSEQPTITLAHG
ncbi:MAG TPA: hypothetical protein DCL48_07515 [Alphaproteobacteria bacterium]|nr:hypothetical protein [Alphaproteobacteria bacterium]